MCQDIHSTWLHKFSYDNIVNAFIRSYSSTAHTERQNEKIFYANVGKHHDGSFVGLKVIKTKLER